MSSYKETEVFDVIAGEAKRQAEGLELIPSENYVSKNVLLANGSILTNKYSEGYPGRRYYGGQEYTDQVETLAIERIKQLFNCKFANVQPHSGAPANLAVYAGLLEPGDTVLGMDLSHGGHLTHGHPMTLPAKIYKFVTYKMKDPETGEIDYDHLREVALEHKPKLIIAGFSAYPRTLDYKKFVDVAKEVGAITMADMAHIAGLIAGKALRNPFDDGFDIITSTTHKTLRGPRGGIILTRESEALTPAFQEYCQQILKNAKAMEAVFHREKIRMIGGGTDNHLILADVFGSLGVTGKEAQTVLDEVGITLNMNSIAGDTRKPLDPSGIRFGTPAITTRGFKEKECSQVAELLIETLRNKDNEAKKKEIKAEVMALASQFPIPESFV